MISRREIIKCLGSLPLVLYAQQFLGCAGDDERPFPPQTPATIYKATGPDPTDITRRLLDGLGGIRSLVDVDDIVILKVNSQWWHQGMTNTDILRAFIEQVLAIPGFAGEVIIADNHQSVTPNDRGWTTDKRNGQFNYNELIRHFNELGHQNVTKYHWHPAGPNPTPLQFGGQGDAVVNHPSEGDGYIWPEDLYYECPYGNRTVLSYPVFTSSYSGVTVDLKNGAFKDGNYIGQPVKFINFSALNHHGRYAGVTASIKNYMGVVDMSCGYPAPYPEGTFNTHHVGASSVFRFMARHMDRLREMPRFFDTYLHPSVFRFRYTGGVLGRYMKLIRKADIHIITAVRVGWGARIHPAMAAQTDTVLASKDPVALDYWAAANVLAKATREAGADEYFVKLNDPSKSVGPFWQFIEECRRELGGTTDPGLMTIVEC